MNWRGGVVCIIIVVLFLPLSSLSINTDTQIFLEDENIDVNPETNNLKKKFEDKKDD